jgi:hypothetical protein
VQSENDFYCFLLLSLRHDEQPFIESHEAMSAEQKRKTPSKMVERAGDNSSCGSDGAGDAVAVT